MSLLLLFAGATVVPTPIVAGARATLLAAPQQRYRIARTPLRFRIGAAERRNRIATGRSMSSAAELTPPQDAGVEIETIGFDFGPALPSGVRLSGTPTISVAVVHGADPTPASRLIGQPTLAISQNTGRVDCQWNQLFGGALAGVTYRLQCVSGTTDGQRLSIWVHFAAVAPN